MPKSLMETPEVSSALETIASQLKCNGGVVGFCKYITFQPRCHILTRPASGMLADADDTAKSIYLLNLLGHTTSCDGMISQFMSPKGHMMTYLGERNLSQSANCNAMMCILNSPELQKHSDVVSKIAESLCDHWWKGVMNDKWVSFANIPLEMII